MTNELTLDDVFDITPRTDSDLIDLMRVLIMSTANNPSGAPSTGMIATKIGFFKIRVTRPKDYS